VPARERAPRGELAAITGSYYDALDESDGTLAPFAKTAARGKRRHHRRLGVAPAPSSVDVEGDRRRPSRATS
jgi:hypothetical protein